MRPRPLPACVELYRTGELHARIEALSELLDPCRLCPRRCEAKRRQGELGVCRAGDGLTVSSAFPHFGEEPPLTGGGGGGDHLPHPLQSPLCLLSELRDQPWW